MCFVRRGVAGPLIGARGRAAAAVSAGCCVCALVDAVATFVVALGFVLVVGLWSLV